MGQCRCDTYGHGFACARNHSLEQHTPVDRCRGVGVCGVEVERKCHHHELPAAVFHHHTWFDLSLSKMKLPQRIFMIGAPGSRWSGIAQNIEDGVPGFNTTDRDLRRTYQHHNFTGHLGAYFGTGWEFDTSLDTNNLDAPYIHTAGTRILKSHEWAYCLDEIHERYPDDWIMLVYRPDMSCYSWWHEAGGFTITYPDYGPYYRDSANMLCEIVKMNQAIMKFAQTHDLTWHHISAKWIRDMFGQAVEPTRRDADTLVTMLKC